MLEQFEQRIRGAQHGVGELESYLGISGPVIRT
jgi:hypothetical protein